ncbi:MAG: UDP-N-acetylmuramoyl-L-alanyl-D-glutamate--2,6-diaminopimelate ligase [Xanthomonadales bacterium]|nr:UDP-N-acetylmuramoyl-L-alanyl-D-glutamate--2,6-diaminopimelate ligase [Gammaproteobacteria bacterium]NNK04965.1 UDP-N-acetylmuramoyl-L-alanyl-D-glutamate--2,6-diaminopimelate ligase [Xanthomonadales bacterium]NNK99430.1 UDP-N-acetylmuramoyl-L-alanyl-D-glutamate--2,6-diaminopimelate ligase [Xanthomonadales bacterium]
MAMTLRELLEGWADHAPETRVTGIGLDNRTITSGDAFVAVRGQLSHGLDYARSAVAAGAVAVIHDGLQAVPDLGVPAIEVAGLGDRLGELASRFYAAPSEQMTIAGVTGTNGKTSVAHFLAQSWQRVYGHAGMVGTLGYGSVGTLQSGARTTPDSLHLQQILAGCAKSGIERLAMEVSSHALHQQRCQTVQFDAAIFTNLSRDHLDYHLDMEDYAAAKRLLFTDYAPSFAIINHDDSYGRQWFGELNGGMQMLSFGLEKGAELRAEIRSMDISGMRLRISGPWGAEEVHTGLLGEFNASNLLAAAGTMALLGMPWHRVLHQVELMQPVPGRMMRLGGDEGQPLVVVDYAHTPDALQSALQAVRAHLDGRLICVFGCGGNRDKGKRPQMGRAAELLADDLVVTSDNPRNEPANRIIEDVVAGLEMPARATIEPDRAVAIQRAIANCRAGDVVLVAGKGHETWQEIGDDKIPFSDEAIILDALEDAA